MVLPPGFKGYPVHLRDAGYFTSNNVKTDYNLRNETEIARSWWSRIGNQAHWRQRAPGQPFMSVINIMDTHQSRSSAGTVEEFEREIGSKLAPGERADPSRVPVPPFYPDTASARAAMARYYDCATVMDRKVGAILAELAADGLAGDTIVFFYGDHGMGMPRGKRLLHDSGMRVPLLIRFPAKWAQLAPATAGTSVDRLVNFVDFAPTLLSLAGAPIPVHFQGTAFLGKAAGSPRRYVQGARDRVDEVYETARSLRDERWLYIRNFRPHLSWAPPEAYSDQSAFRRELLAQARAGKLGTGATAWLAPTRPREELYDTIKDPHQLQNLADSSDSAAAAALKRMRADLRAWLLEIRDTAFLAEEDAYARAGDGAVFDVARRAGAYPFERVLAMAELVGDSRAVAQQRAGLRDEDAAVRYWAAIGFAANQDGTREARADLTRAMADRLAAVRIEAAGALFSATGEAAARELLIRELKNNDANVALQAARTLELLGRLALPALEPIRARHALALSRERDSQLERYIGFSLGAWLKSSARE
jgi:arylsulfatase A-like enzyme